MGRARRGALPLSNEWEVFWIGSGNWIVDNLNSALEMWNERLAEIWQLISISPEEFKGGGVWNVIININGALKAVGYALLVLFFVMGVVKTCGSFAEIKKPEVAFKCFVRFILAQAAVTCGYGDHDDAVPRGPGDRFHDHGLVGLIRLVCYGTTQTRWSASLKMWAFWNRSHSGR